jgi:hypothetical protein
VVEAKTTMILCIEKHSRYQEILVHTRMIPRTIFSYIPVILCLYTFVYTYIIHIDQWIDGWMDVWMDGWMDGWMDRWMIVDAWHIVASQQGQISTWSHAKYSGAYSPGFLYHRVLY